MVVIRLARAGTRNRPFYHVVATDRRDPRDGRHLERLGYFNPRFSGQAKRIELNLNRVDYWLSVGAQPSPRVTSLLKELKKAAATATPPIEQITQPEPEAAPEQPAAKSKPKKTLTRKKSEKPEKTEE